MTPQDVQPRDDRLLDVLAGDYRSFVIRRLRVAPERRGVGWISSTICSHPAADSEEYCHTCETWAHHLALAFTDSHPADVPHEARPESSPREQVHLWVGLESVCGDVRDVELVRLDFDFDPDPGAGDPVQQ